MAFYQPDTDEYLKLVSSEYHENKENLNVKYKHLLHSIDDFHRNHCVKELKWLLNKGNFRKLSDNNFSASYIPNADLSVTTLLSFLLSDKVDPFATHKKHVEKFTNFNAKSLSASDNVKENYLYVSRHLTSQENSFLLCVDNCKTDNLERFASKEEGRKCFSECFSHTIENKNKIVEENVNYFQ